MRRRFVKKLPNILSTIRICLVPVFIAVYFSEEGTVKVYSALVYAVASFTDFLDGYLARKYGNTSNLGKVLDPLGDKLMTVAVMVCITIDGIIPLWAVLAAFCKEALMGIGGLVMHKKLKTEIPPSNIIGKLSTVTFFLVCVTLMLIEGISRTAATVMISVAIGLMFVALGSYILNFMGVAKKSNKQG